MLAGALHCTLRARCKLQPASCNLQAATCNLQPASGDGCGTCTRVHPPQSSTGCVCPHALAPFLVQATRGVLLAPSPAAMRPCPRLPPHGCCRRPSCCVSSSCRRSAIWPPTPALCAAARSPPVAQHCTCCQCRPWGLLGQGRQGAGGSQQMTQRQRAQQLPRRRKGLGWEQPAGRAGTASAGGVGMRLTSQPPVSRCGSGGRSWRCCAAPRRMPTGSG